MNFIRLAFLALTLLEAGHASAQTYPDHNPHSRWLHARQRD
jgi:hypothetical protein